MTLSSGTRHRPGGEERLVVGVRVQEDQGGHGDILPPWARPRGEWEGVA